MKTTALLILLITLLCGARIVRTATRGDSAGLDDYEESNMIKNNYFIEKRNKPSLSIVNPLDVLRQRLLLEIARRQMKENTRQVELNRAILKNVGKRGRNGRYRYPLSLLPDYQLQLLGQPHQEAQHQEQPLHKLSPAAKSAYLYLFQRQPPLSTDMDVDIDVVTNSDDNNGDCDDNDVGNKSLDSSSVRNQCKNYIDNDMNHRNTFGQALEAAAEHKYNENDNAEPASHHLQYLYELHKNNFPHK